MSLIVSSQKGAVPESLGKSAFRIKIVALLMHCGPSSHMLWDIAAAFWPYVRVRNTQNFIQDKYRAKKYRDTRYIAKIRDTGFETIKN